MTIQELAALPLDKRLEVAKKIAESTIMSYEEVRCRLETALHCWMTRVYELPIVVAEILVELDRVKEV